MEAALIWMLKIRRGNYKGDTMKKMIDLDMPSILGVGISGPVLAFLTATIYSAFGGMCKWDNSAYAVIMLVLSALLAAFPASKSGHKTLLKIVMWPIATVMIFASAWGSSSGLSIGEEAAASQNGTKYTAGEKQGAVMFSREVSDDSVIHGHFFKRLK